MVKFSIESTRCSYKTALWKGVAHHGITYNAIYGPRLPTQLISPVYITRKDSFTIFRGHFNHQDSVKSTKYHDLILLVSMHTI